MELPLHWKFSRGWCDGGLILTKYNVIVTFNGTNNLINNLANNNDGGAISAQENTLLSFNGTSYFRHDSAVHDCGGAISTHNNVVLSFSGTINYSAFQGGAIYAAFNKLSSFSGTHSFSRNSALQGGAIFANHDSILTEIQQSISFTKNGNHLHKDSQGGAMHLYTSSNFSILPNTTVCCENNHATLGGAIYIPLFTALRLPYLHKGTNASFNFLLWICPVLSNLFQEQLCWCCRKCDIWWCTR